MRNPHRRGCTERPPCRPKPQIHQRAVVPAAGCDRIRQGRLVRPVLVAFGANPLLAYPACTSFPGRTPLRDAANKTTSSDRAGLPANIAPSPCPLPLFFGQNLGQNPFVLSAEDGRIPSICRCTERSESWIRTL